VITLGIDLASQDEDTATCEIEWSSGEARVRPPRCPQSDADLIAAVRAADVAGIDIPLGWPDAFVQAVSAYQAGGPWPDMAPAAFCYRATDDHVTRRLRERDIKRRPLSVASDRIAIPTMRAARVLSGLAAGQTPVDRTGAGKLVEAYPAAALEMWGLSARGYKGRKGAEVRSELFSKLEHRTRAWLRMNAAVCSTCCDVDHALDALVAALVARAAALGLCEPPPAHLAARAAREGWIALPPADALDRLV
jgi:predicted nuclease with RNAse H fold